LKALGEALKKGVHFIRQKQRADGSWRGEISADTQNTACCIIALLETGFVPADSEIKNGVKWLIRNQNPDGGWGECKGRKSTFDFTLLALHALEKTHLDISVVEQARENAIKFLEKQQNPKSSYVLNLTDRSREALLAFFGSTDLRRYP
jgi:prenyltransferase beta subunit